MITGAHIRTLRLELARGGVFEHRTTATWWKLAAMLAALAACIAGVLVLPWWCAIVLVPLAAVPAVTAAMIGHEAGHGSFSASKPLNAVMLHLLFPIFGGLGALHWNQKHNQAHHGQPNVVDHDPDLNVWPMAISSVAHAESGRFGRWFQRELQGYLFWPLTLLLAFTMRVESILHLVRRTRARGLDRAVVIDAGCLAAHYALWLVVPSLVFGVGAALAFYAALWSIVGLLLALVFSPAHMGLPVTTTSGNRWLHQLATTRNLLMPRALSWLFVGLDHQVEHHFFPRIPHQNLRAARDITAAWCARHDAPHLEIGYGAAVADVTRFMFEAWRLAPVLDIAPSVARSAEAAPPSTAVLAPARLTFG